VRGATVLKEFREFLLRGNLIDLAIAIVIGTAFVAVVKSLIDNIVMPIIGALIGKPSFAGLTFTIHDSIFHYGQFLTDLLLFVLIAAVVFFFVAKPTAVVLNRFAKKKLAEPDVAQELLADIKRLLEEQNGLLRK
jgi:large conductance mechanosensitive channel